jgi:hypothetical protein
MQHLISDYREEDVEDEAATEDLLQRRSESDDGDRWQRGESIHDIARLFDGKTDRLSKSQHKAAT